MAILTAVVVTDTSAIKDLRLSLPVPPLISLPLPFWEPGTFRDSNWQLSRPGPIHTEVPPTCPFGSSRLLTLAVSTGVTSATPRQGQPSQRLSGVCRALAPRLVIGMAVVFCFAASASDREVRRSAGGGSAQRAFQEEPAQMFPSGIRETDICASG